MNKTFTFFTVLYFISQPAFAQFTKGQKLVGGNISFATNSGSYTPNFDNRNVYHNSTTVIGVNPSIAKFSSATTLYGLGIVYYFNHYFNKEEAPDNGNSFKDNSHSGGINIFFQRFIPLGKNFFFTIFSGGTALYTYEKRADFVSKATSKIKGYSIAANLAPGLSYKINKRFLFDAFLNNLLYAGYQHSTTTLNYPQPHETKTRNNSFVLLTSLSNTNVGNIGLGFRWLLKNK